MSLMWNTITDLPRLNCYEEASMREEKTETLWRSPHEAKRHVKPLSDNRRRYEFSIRREWGNVIVHYGCYWWYSEKDKVNQAKQHTACITYCPNDVVYLNLDYTDSSKRSFLRRVIPNAPNFRRERGCNVMTDKHGRDFVLPPLVQLELQPSVGGLVREVTAYREGKRKDYASPMDWGEWIQIPAKGEEPPVVAKNPNDLFECAEKSHPLQQLVLKPSRKRMNAVMRNYQDGIKLLKAAISMHDTFDQVALREELAAMGLPHSYHYTTNIAWMEVSNLKPIVWMLADKSQSYKLVPFIASQVGGYSKYQMDGQKFIKYYANELDRLLKDMIRRVHAVEVFDLEYLPLGEVKFNRWASLCKKDFAHLT